MICLRNSEGKLALEELALGKNATYGEAVPPIVVIGRIDVA